MMRLPPLFSLRIGFDCSRRVCSGHASARADCFFIIVISPAYGRTDILTPPFVFSYEKTESIRPRRKNNRREGNDEDRMTYMDRLPDLPPRGTRMLLAVACILLAFGVYGASLGNGFVRWDDGSLIYQNPAVVEMSWSAVKRAFSTYDPELYVPLTLLSYQADHALGDGSPFPFHLQSLLLHAFNALFVCWLAYLLLRNRLSAVLIGAVFLVHPLHTEAVAWASGRKDLLSAFFFLGSLLAWLYWRDRGDRRLYLLSVGLFALGLFAKVMVLTLPLVLLILCWLRGGGITRRDIKETLAFFALSVIFGIVALFGKTDVNAASTMLEKLLMAGKSTMFYLQKLVLPLDLSVLYPYPETITLRSPDFFLPLLMLAVLLGIAIVSLRYTRMIAAGFALYLVTLSPTFINIAKGADTFYSASDRYAYIPSIGILLIAGFLIARFLEQDVRMSRMRARVRGVTTGGVALTAVLGVLASAQSLVWRDTVTLFEHAIALAPAPSYEAHNNLGNAYRSRGEFEKALKQYDLSVGIKPHSRTYANMGAVYRSLGRFDEAHDAYRDALRIEPRSAEAHFGLGILFAAQGREQEALASYDRALAFAPDMAHAYVNIGAVHMHAGRTDDALAAYRKAIGIDPLFTDAYYNLAVLQTQLMQFDEAIVSYERAIDLRPRNTSARINVALLHMQQGQQKEAVAHFRAILQYDPQNAAARSALEQLREAL